MHYVACVKLVGIELPVILPVQYAYANVVVGRGTVEGRGVSAVLRACSPLLFSLVIHL